jgi:hypothetical protein
MIIDFLLLIAFQSKHGKDATSQIFVVHTTKLIATMIAMIPIVYIYIRINVDHSLPSRRREYGTAVCASTSPCLLLIS